MTKRKAAGPSDSLPALVHPELQTVEALRDISFEMENGELLSLIGPNGAGKSTTMDNQPTTAVILDTNNGDLPSAIEQDVNNVL